MISAKELEDRDKNKKNVKKELYTKILTQLCRRIKLHHEIGRSECTLYIPEFIIGYPSFDIEQMTVYMHRQLSRLKYRASVLYPGVIHVAWGEAAAEASSSSKKKKAAAVASSLDDEEDLPSLANLKKAADTLRKKYETTTK